MSPLIKKLLALTKEGIGGERDNAHAKLAALLRKHGLTFADIENVETKTMIWFKPDRKAGPFARKLLSQVIHAVTPLGSSTYKHRRLPGEIGVEVTAAQHMEIELRYAAYSRGLRKDMETCYRAFVQVNNIFNPEAPACDDTDEDELKALQRMMHGVTAVEVRKALPLSA